MARLEALFRDVVSWGGGIRLKLIGASALLSLAIFWLAPADPGCACAVDDATAHQPTLDEARAAFGDAGANQLGEGYFTLPQIEKGYPEYTLVSATVPCVILKAIGFVESAWHQAQYGVPRGETGPTLVSASCGYGVMQITSCMTNPGDCGLDPAVQQAIASDYRYNIGWGAKMLVDKWNAGDYWGAVIGQRDPEVAEDWYYAVWAYNWWAFKNNPNNPDYPWPRPPFDCWQGETDATNYPYQELVWGCAANPPSEGGEALWSSVPLTLPDRDAIGTDPGWIDTPQPSHSDPCQVETPFTQYLPALWKQFYSKEAPPWPPAQGAG